MSKVTVTVMLPDGVRQETTEVASDLPSGDVARGLAHTLKLRGAGDANTAWHFVNSLSGRPIPPDVPLADTKLRPGGALRLVTSSGPPPAAGRQRVPAKPHTLATPVDTAPVAPDIVLCFSTAHRPLAESVCRCLEQGGLHCWVASRDGRPGAPLPTLADAARRCRVVVAVHPMDKGPATDLLTQVIPALTLGATIVPVRVGEATLSKDVESRLAAIRRALQVEEGTPPAGSEPELDLGDLDDRLARLKAVVEALEDTPANHEG